MSIFRNLWGGKSVKSPRRTRSGGPDQNTNTVQSAEENRSFRFVQLSAGGDTVVAADTPVHASADAIDIWIVPQTAMAQIAREHDVLSDEERAHAKEITHRQHRTRYIAVRTALRFALSHRVQNAVNTDYWRISTPPFGKPQVCSEQANCSFSITHSDDFSVIAIAPDSTVGVDAERIDPAKIKHLPVNCLSENEQKNLKAKAVDDQYNDFFRFWTLKEAYTKAIGMGMSLDFESIEFAIEPNGAQASVPHPKSAESEQYELLTLKYMEFEHLLAICLLGVAQGAGQQAAKNLFVIEPSAEGFGTDAGSEMEIVDSSLPERIELYSLEDLPSLLHNCFEEHAQNRPDQIALDIDGKTITYGELEKRANALAAHLAARGAGPGRFVGAYHPQSIELFISVLAIAKTGAAYVPFDPKSSAEAIGKVASHHGVEMAVTTSLFADHLAAAGIADVFLTDRPHTGTPLDAEAMRAHTADVRATSPSHVVFMTDGRETPQGVVVAHGEAVKFAHSLAAVYGIEDHHRCFQDAHLAFDVALEEIWAMFSVGATVVLHSAAEHPQTDEVAADFIARNRISVVSTAPERLEALNVDLPSVEILIVGRKPCETGLAVKWALRTGRFVSIKRPGDRFPTFSIEQENGAAWRPRMLPPHVTDRPSA